MLATAVHGCGPHAHARRHTNGGGTRGCAARTRAELEPLLFGLLEEFAREVRRLYGPEHQHAGRIVGVDRDGRAKEFPFMRCRVAVLELPRGVISGDEIRIDAAIAHGKSDARA